MKKLYNQVKRDQWREDPYSMPVIARYGTGGGNVPIVLESNQNHATALDTEIYPTLPASMGLGGGYVPMILWSDYISDDPTPKVGGALPLPSKQNGGDA